MHYVISIKCIVSCNETPRPKDLQNYIAIRYAPSWREIGTGLELTEERLDIIDVDHMHIEKKCNAMLSHWLKEKADTATWMKLLSVLDLSAASSTHRIKPVVTISPGKLG